MHFKRGCLSANQQNQQSGGGRIERAGMPDFAEAETTHEGDDVVARPGAWFVHQENAGWIRLRVFSRHGNGEL